MAISKILHMNDCGTYFHGKHLKSALDYVMNPEKTQGGRWVGAVNCQADTAFEQMKETKRQFEKTDKRQGYHLILSFAENEVEADTAFEITGKFVEEYLEKRFEAVYVVHDNTAHIHSHIVFNSVSFLDGKKYRYEKGDWAKYIQPLTNRLCEEYGLSVINIEESSSKNKQDKEKARNPYSRRVDWSDMIKRDLDACVLQADDFEMFEKLLMEKGYEVKHGKLYAVKPPGMDRYRRIYRLGEDYTEERIKERIIAEDLAFYQRKKEREEQETEVADVFVTHCKKAKLSGLQKKYYAKLYQTGQLIKKPYSQVWKYKKDIQNMNRLQEQYLFLVKHDIKSIEELVSVVDTLADKKTEINEEKSRVYKARQKYKDLFAAADSMEKLRLAELSFQNGDTYFLEEHQKWGELLKQLEKAGYTMEELVTLKQYYREEAKRINETGAAIAKEQGVGCAILHDVEVSDEIAKEMVTEKKRESMDDQPERTAVF